MHRCTEGGAPGKAKPAAGKAGSARPGSGSKKKKQPAEAEVGLAIVLVYYTSWDVF